MKLQNTERIARIIKNPFIRNPIFVAFIVFFITIAIMGYNLFFVDHLLVLRAPDGITPGFSGTKYDVFSIVASALVAFGINLFLAYALYDKSRLLSYILAYLSLFLAILILIEIGVIISAN